MIKINLKTETPAFDGRHKAHEVSRILTDLARKIEMDGLDDPIKLRDFHGNVVGEMKT